MDLLIVADLEGISCVERRSVCDSTHPSYSSALGNYAAEVNAVAVAARRIGIERVMLLDWHGRLLPPGLLEAGIEAASLPLPTGRWVAVLLGFHARTGQSDAFAPQTLCPGWRIVWNGREAGELALASRWLGELGIPLVLVTGDRGLTREAEGWVEQTAAVAVKRALSAEEAECLPVERTRAALADALAWVLMRRSWWWVYRPELPVRWDIVSPDGQHQALESSSVAEALCRVQEVIPGAALAVRCHSETSE
ncbi:M55 family metallopeptidase [Thermomicrobium sp. 4228-Ro]|uniref:M55 family metallopeptidase n=1 Tax=Thermomicrobium sp. 4228-Ro TaxID=2993937 RepID=UPI002248D4A1|nr:M55 family metallopeptidase [Thermomicrobium sp. 4228-Ro]MCX2727904.1 M55 family metallopeptidase [Thermomicrobium sp. 4228-Ro]